MTCSVCGILPVYLMISYDAPISYCQRTRFLASNHYDWLPESNMTTAVVNPSTLNDVAYQSVRHLDLSSASFMFNHLRGGRRRRAGSLQIFSIEDMSDHSRIFMVNSSSTNT
jgi:hypothetical protein